MDRIFRFSIHAPILHPPVSISSLCSPRIYSYGPMHELGNLAHMFRFFSNFFSVFSVSSVVKSFFFFPQEKDGKWQ
ncbi:MAG TPA: hypothetical protein VHO48_15390, partial [Anaerolineaceae bacterium]|nr:hypothetical protein [Anaerolineaceae bacterium]